MRKKPKWWWRLSLYYPNGDLYMTYEDIDKQEGLDLIGYWRDIQVDAGYLMLPHKIEFYNENHPFVRHTRTTQTS